mmetsp:Transcript_8560/g.11807  ORF Transcript_8560/g.11807 Transcript_8560/m.11807 type:complete len:164 (-) Transcript_8560:208-699(-)|eukprot:CAMPEP_0185728766 /NCGR_PEP_ID=MMETSP1171-20130828/4151_1 /TAXON_ID=374046 /ORGANISM="Helicotheca tamensis, Strain CCMP826" /LENGTH=163 /DNA_ID=CAMNT_0028397509 /DNA_START=124 /DNA_END=615 /DNA_ORIENTATION=+
MIRLTMLSATFTAALLYAMIALSSYDGVSAVSVKSMKKVIPLLKQQDEYTPLIFFTVPKGTMPASDKMEKIVSAVEKEMNVKVQRFDVLRDRMSRKLYEKIIEGEIGDRERMFPMLYHRESRQKVFGLSDPERVKSWAKGRWLPPDETVASSFKGKSAAGEQF